MSDIAPGKLLRSIMMMLFFSVLALDIAVPAAVLLVMAASRWAVEHWPVTNDSLFGRKARMA
ncbi:hypothetical protein FE840_011670 [Peteryoungia desertarenae]|uniref:Uncharacterized protein n=1 Tax=Peteryoungia desertarenae TaxID=1813451 RepID=A0ABX6QHK2_9HYPH|nr:hypothetical protein [Peteryoungia desertarenae]QLF68069.1 hypothetical protein FE840_011670 [Peteryoungia desertarenae]